MMSISTLRSTIMDFILRTRYRKDILGVLLLKLIALFLLWFLFFSHPVEKKLTNTQLTERFTS